MIEDAELGSAATKMEYLPQIRPHLWFDNQAREAAEFYVSTFPGSRVTASTVLPGTPSGDTEIVAFELFGQGFMAISAGPLFTFTPAISFFVNCSSEEEVDEYWAALSEGGSVMMPLDSYRFSPRYGWTSDRYGLSWQIGVMEEAVNGQGITPMLLFTGDVAGKAEEAIEHYTSIFPDAKVPVLERWGDGHGPERPGTVHYTEFILAGQRFRAMDTAAGHGFAFNEAVSLLIDCETQDEIDHYWAALSAVPEAEQCGWLKDRFGVSWQVAPALMDEMIADGSPEQVARVTEAFLKMKKLDIAALQRAYEAG